jgi:hypothetical protein
LISFLIWNFSKAWWWNFWMVGGALSIGRWINERVLVMCMICRQSRILNLYNLPLERWFWFSAALMIWGWCSFL